RPRMNRALASKLYEQFLPLSKIFRRDCIQSLRCGVMLAERKKWKLANNMPTELLGNGAEKFGSPSWRCFWPLLVCSFFSFHKRAPANQKERQQLRQLSIIRWA